MTTRRGFIGLMLATASAPAIVKSSSLMKIWAPSQEIILPQNKLLTVNDITREALKILENNLSFSSNLNQSYDELGFMHAQNLKKSIRMQNKVISKWINTY